MAKKILVVDDEPDLLDLIKFRFKKWGYDVIYAANGQEALDKIQREAPDLVVLDLRLPIISGHEVCKRIKADDNTKNIPVILFTASVSSDLGQKAKELGADDYIVKPFDPEALLGKVKKLIG